MNGNIVGIDIGKSVFHMVAMDSGGHIVEKKKFSRAQLLNHLANKAIGAIGMEVCLGAHFLAKALSKQGHEVRLIPAQYVKPFVKTNKNDFVDAEAIAEAAQRPTMRFVPVKTDEQLDLQALHRARQRWIGRRTCLINQIRAFLLERGITVRTGPSYLRGTMVEILANESGMLSASLLGILGELWEEWTQIDERVAKTDERMQALAREDEACRRLQTIPGIGIVTASALVAAVGNGSAFHKGRDLAAWLGLAPRQYSTGGKSKLLGIGKRGNMYLRQLFAHGARAVFARLKREKHHIGSRLDQLGARKKPSVVIVAMANKLARIAWAVLTGNQNYRAAPLAETA